MSTSEARAVQTRWNVAPYFIVDDVVNTANFYRDKLGFSFDRLWGEPPSFCMVTRRGIVIMLSQLERTGLMRPNQLVDTERGAWDAYVWVDEVDMLYQEFTSQGVRIASEICDQMYGCRDFTIEDYNGYRICFGQILQP